MKGIDLSHYQEGLDLSSLKRGGYSFAILKLSEGRGIPDASFDKFYDMAQAHNIPVGAYVFSHATNASVAQAEAVYAIGLLKGRPLQLGVFMDIETTGQMQIPKEQLKHTVIAFKDTINRAGYDFGIYGSEYNAWSRLSTDDFADCSIWVAHYGKAPEIPCDLWQQTDKGAFPGYYGAVDVDEAVSDRFKALVSEPTPEPHEEKVYPVNVSIGALQLVMKENGYWGDATGRYSAAFVEALHNFADGIRLTWEGRK